ncbi:hypothetical protein E2493_13130 [Sphingomonas parva]|uniref:DUF6916 domain-containing protein n=1 Tax=Sphingomonas parva TaxID=2555898 RepID=A0A4Y8ZTH5_9SPHN|nr:hypothetical protein [Sphingomonas parva]TFI57766.1 hypothetical protein E2493_13130 [Sphingomonas parva]
MSDLTVDDFAVGEDYSVGAAEGLVLHLDLVQPLPQAVREGGGFRLEFVGPTAPVLPQAIYALSRDGEQRDIFLVPVARDARGVRYEAIFN